MTGHLLAAASPMRWWVTLTRTAVMAAAIAVDAIVIVAMAVLIGSAYHLIVYDGGGPTLSFIEIGVVTTTIFVLPGAINGDYSVASYLSVARLAR